MTLGSLFDGIGGFPFIASMYGITPVWASEIEPAPISITRRHFPGMVHLGDITKINGAQIAPVNIITFGSPCQDLSVAGKRAGLEGKRSGLFMQAARIIKEMREATDGKYPNFAVWENVPGAFSSNNGEDFRAVLEELAAIQNGNADVPRPKGGVWADAGFIVGDGFTLAWRTLDAQYMGVPQRRRRIYLIIAFDDLTGKRAAEILFKPDSERRHLTLRGAPWQRFTGSVKSGAEGMKCLNPEDGQSARIYDESGVYCNLNANSGGGQNRAGVLTYPQDDTARTLSARADSSPCVDRGQNFVIRMRSGCGGGGKGALIGNDLSHTLRTENDQTIFSAAFMGGQGVKAGGIGYQEEISPTLKSALGGGNTVPTICIQGNSIDRTLTARMGTGGNQVNAVCQKTYKMQRSDKYEESNIAATQTARQFKNATDLVAAVDCRNGTENANINGTLQAKDSGGTSLNLNNIARVGYTVRRLTPMECERLQGYPDGYTEYGVDGKISDAQRYKALGNSLALPCADYVIRGILEVSA